MTKALIILLVLVGFGVGGYLYIDYAKTATEQTAITPTSAPEVIPTLPVEVVSMVEPGVYELLPELSGIVWSAKKPLIEGYINSGTIPVASGTIEMMEVYAVGTTTLDMQGLTVGLTAKKPGQEGVLEEHLKKADFFDTEEYPTGEFHLKSLTPQADVATSYAYDLVGNLTLKGITNEVQFPATLQMVDGQVRAKAQFSIDRTLWDIKLGSASFFSDLGNNMIDDMVSIELTLVARPAVVTQEEATTTPIQSE